MALLPFFSGSRSNTVWDPFTSLFEPFEGRPEHGPGQSFAKDAHAIARTRVDWVETPEAHVFKADLPGLRKEEIKVELEDGNILKISGSRRHEEVKETDKWHHVERSQGEFLRRFRLPGNVEVDKTEAKVENGVLSVTIPKVQEKKPEARSIDIKESSSGTHTQS